MRAERAWNRMLPVPFCFMGMGIFRVWTETLYANNQLDFPALTPPFDLPFSFLTGYSLFDLVAAVFLLGLALLARKIAPLYRHPSAIAATVVCMVGAACLNFGSMLVPEVGPVLFWPSVVLGGIGIALILMLWSEFFGCITPLRVALYYSASISVGCVILWIFKGLSFWWLWIGACIVPVVSLICLWRAYATLPPAGYPPAYQVDFSFPWKPVAVVGVNSFIYGFRNGIFTGVLAMNSGIGAFAGALLIYILICRTAARDTARESASSSSDKSKASGSRVARGASFNYSILYRVAIPLMFVSLIPLEGTLPGWQFVADTCALASYTILLVLIMAILANLSFNYGVCALWIFAIERAVRLLTTLAGRTVGAYTPTFEANPVLYTIVLLAMAVMLALVAVLFFSEKSLSSSAWGVVLKHPAVENSETNAGSERNRLGVKCRDLSRQYGLTPREEEILLLVAQKHTLGQMARELYIGTNTVKTHTKHLYQKLGVHSRQDVLRLLGVREEE